jgi:hypothetical protein
MKTAARIDFLRLLAHVIPQLGIPMKTRHYIVPSQGEIQLQEETLDIELETPMKGNPKIEKIPLPNSPNSKKAWLDLLQKLETDFTALLSKDLVLCYDTEETRITLPSDASDASEWLTNLKEKLQQLTKRWRYQDAMAEYQDQDTLMRKMEQPKP